MKSVAITGHKKGIGLALAEIMQEQYIVHGFSRSNGYDISTDYRTIIKEAHDCDIFVNNAHWDHYQTILFENLFSIWKNDSSKTIVNINSRAKYLTGNNDYYKDKKILDSVTKKHLFGRKCRIINVSPGYVLTESSKESIERFNMPYMSTHQCAEYIKWSIEQSIEIWELSLWKI